MITLVHGADIVFSLNFFVQQKNKNSLTFDSQNLTLSELEQSLLGSSLFGQGKKVFIENLFTKKAAKNYEPIVTLLQKISNEVEVYLYADKELGVKALSGFPKYTNQVFKINKNVFGFLDSIRPNNPQNLVNFHMTLEFSEAEIVFFMIIRQFRLLLGIADDSKNNIDELKRLAPWQKSKMVSQASLFGQEKLKSIYKKIYKIDKAQKTGKSSQTLVQDIDIFLLEI